MTKPDSVRDTVKRAGYATLDITDNISKPGFLKAAVTFRASVRI